MDDFLRYVPLLTMIISVVSLIVITAMKIGDIKHIVQWIEKYEPRIELVEKQFIEQNAKCKLHYRKR